MGSKSKAPPPPDYTPLINASKEMSKEQLAFQREQYAWAKEAYAENKVVSDQVANQMLRAQEFNQTNAEEDRERWENEFRPVEDRFVQDAMDYASPERREMEMGRAQAAVAQQFEGARNAATQKLESFGVDPSATRYAALDIGLRAQQAASQAAAGNQAGMATDAMGRQLMGQAIQLGRQSLGQGMGMQSIANQSGTGAVNSGLATTASGAQTMGTATQYAGLASNSLNNAAGMMNMGYQNALGAYKAEQDASSGWGSALGLVGGLINGAKSGGAAGLGLFMEDGGAVPTTGGAVPLSASPSGGQQVDDVPARLNAGEFVMPKDVTSWKGEEFFQKLIEQSRKAKQGAGAKPEVGMAPNQPPAFVSRPQQDAALPLR